MIAERRRIATAILLAVSLAVSAGAQDNEPLARLEARTRYQVELMLDSARIAGLPTAPLISRALEGASKQKGERAIVFAVRNLLRNLRDARAALGPNASSDELAAAASVLSLGVPSVDLQQLGRVRQDKPMTYALVVLADLITRGVPRQTASQTIMSLWQRGAGDDDLAGLWRGVERDIVSGTDPGVALVNRAREIPTRGPPPVAPAAPSGRPEPETRNR